MGQVGCVSFTITWLGLEPGFGEHGIQVGQQGLLTWPAMPSAVAPAASMPTWPETKTVREAPVTSMPCA